MAKVAKEGSKWVRQLIFNTSRYKQYGLYHDDCLDETKAVKEALRRLPAYLQDERAYRISRALDLNVKKDILPKQNWVQFEEDQTKGRYLRPYLNEVHTEIAELQEWDSK